MDRFLPLLVALLLAGCDRGAYDRPAVPREEAEREPVVEEMAEYAAEQAPESPPPQGTAPVPVAPSTPPPAPTATQPQVRLSTGVALPQTGPAGIMMGFSVDYEYLGPPPGPSSEFVWVIRRSQGSPQVVAEPVPLAARGTLQTFIPGWRPEEGPFDTWIEAVSGPQRGPLCAPLPLQ